MKTLKSFILESNRNKRNSKQLNFLSWPGSHAEMRELSAKALDDKLKKHRHKQDYTKKHSSTHRNIKEGWDDYDEDFGDIDADEEEPDHSEIHRHPKVRPQQLLPEHKVVISHYTSTGSSDINGHRSSENMNNYLRNRSGDLQSKMTKRYPEKKMEDSITALSSAFTRENTNRMPVEAHSGVPARIGHALMKAGAGSAHTIAGFTSTSTDPDVAHEFADMHRRPPGVDEKENPIKDRHVLRVSIQEGAGLSVRHLSKHSHEHEMLLNHGSKMQYNKTVKAPNDVGGHDYTHHVDVHPQSASLDEYTNKYKH